MTYTIARVPNESILAANLSSPFDPQLEPAGIIHEIGKLTNDITASSLQGQHDSALFSETVHRED